MNTKVIQKNASLVKASPSVMDILSGVPEDPKIGLCFFENFDPNNSLCWVITTNGTFTYYRKNVKKIRTVSVTANLPRLTTAAQEQRAILDAAQKLIQTLTI